jgi:hypothetical protein
MKKLLVLSFAVASVGAHALTFSNVIAQSPPLSTGWSFNTNANSITFFTPNAIVGDPVAPLRAATLNLQYDADATGGPNAYADDVVVNLQTLTLGSGTIFFTESVFELDSNGNEVSNGLLGTVSQTLNANSGMSWSGTIMFSRDVQRFRAKKAFTMVAPDTANFDVAALGLVNQSIRLVPEPGTFVALGLGAVALLRRKRSK